MVTTVVKKQGVQYRDLGEPVTQRMQHYGNFYGTGTLRYSADAES